MLTATTSDFDVFKSNVCHQLHASGDIEFIRETLDRKEIEKRFVKKEYAESLYLLALVDYLCRINKLEIPAKFDSMRRLKLEKPVYPKSMRFLAMFSENRQMVRDMLRQSIPEFRRFNIYEGDIRNVV